MNATLQCRENLDLGLPVPGLPFPPHHSPCRLNLSLEVGVGQIRNAWARGSLCESTTGWVQSQQPPLAALSVTLMASTPSQEAAHDKRAFTPPPPALPRISSSTSSALPLPHPSPHYKGWLVWPRARSRGLASHFQPASCFRRSYPHTVKQMTQAGL